MTQQEKDTLIAKIEVLKSSIADAQLQAVAGLVLDTAWLLPVEEPHELGFTKRREDQ